MNSSTLNMTYVINTNIGKVCCKRIRTGVNGKIKRLSTFSFHSWSVSMKFGYVSVPRIDVWSSCCTFTARRLGFIPQERIDFSQTFSAKTPINLAILFNFTGKSSYLPYLSLFNELLQDFGLKIVGYFE